MVTQSNFDQVEDRVSCRLIGKVLAIVFCFLVEFNRQLENVYFPIWDTDDTIFQL